MIGQACPHGHDPCFYFIAMPAPTRSAAHGRPWAASDCPPWKLARSWSSGACVCRAMRLRAKDDNGNATCHGTGPALLPLFSVANGGRAHTRDTHATHTTGLSRDLALLQHPHVRGVPTSCRSAARVVRIMETHNGLTGLIVEAASATNQAGEVVTFDGMWSSSLTASSAMVSLATGGRGTGCCVVLLV